MIGNLPQDGELHKSCGGIFKYSLTMENDGYGQKWVCNKCGMMVQGNE